MRLLPVLVAAALACPAAHAARPVQEGYRAPGDLDALGMEGLKRMYALDFGAAEATFTKMTELNPAHPAGYVFLAGLRWWMRSQRFDIAEADKDLKDRFFDAAAKAAQIAEDRKAWGGSKDEMHFYMGMAIGMVGRWHATHYNWMRAYYWGKRANKHLMKAIRAKPYYYDAYLGPGIFDYYSATLPGVLKLASLAFIRGDKERGLDYIQTTMAKGRYNRIEAKIFLIGVVNETERKPEEALKLAQELVEENPENQFFRLLQLMTILRAKRWEELHAKATALLADVHASGTPYMRDQISLIHLYKANASMGLGDFERVVAEATEGIESSPDPKRGWVTYCMLRRAMANDLLGNRTAAVEEFDKVLERDEFWYEHRDAKHGRREPYTHERVMELILE